MVREELDDGVRIARLLSSEITGHEDPPFDALAVTNVNDDVEPSPDGARAFDVSVSATGDRSAVPSGGERLGRVFVHDDHARLELGANVQGGFDAARDAADAAGLEVRESDDPPRLVVDVENGAKAKRAIDVLVAAIEGQ